MPPWQQPRRGQPERHHRDRRVRRPRSGQQHVVEALADHRLDVGDRPAEVGGRQGGDQPHPGPARQGAVGGGPRQGSAWSPQTQEPALTADRQTVGDGRHEGGGRRRRQSRDQRALVTAPHLVQRDGEQRQ